MALYSMQSAKIPRLICEDIDKKTRKFIWGGNDEKRGIHLISWEVLQRPMEKGGIGVFSAKQANVAFLTKLGWSMLSEPNVLWSRVLRAKYCKGRCDVDMFEPKTGMFNVWSGITENLKTLNEGLRTAIGNGTKTLFWDHEWATDVTLSSLATQPFPAELEGATVEEMWEEGEGWRWNIFAPYLDQNTLKKIQSYEVRPDPSLGDLVYWKDGDKGKFTIKSVISIMKHHTDILDEDCWEVVWSAPVQQRIRAFLWLACHDRILISNSNRFKHKLMDDPKCYICGASEETTLHILRDCPAARVVWRKTVDSNTMGSFYQGGLKDWITANAKDLDPVNEDSWATYFCISVWWIWRWRNCFVFNRRDEMPIDFVAFLQVRYDEARRAIWDAIGDENARKKYRIPANMTWHAPPYEWYVINSDGAAKGNPGSAGGGAIIRDYTGNLVTAFASNFGYCSAFRAEVLALTRGLEIARNLHIDRLEVQMDNAAVVQALQKQEITRGECIHDIQFSKATRG